MTVSTIISESVRVSVSRKANSGENSLGLMLHFLLALTLALARLSGAGHMVKRVGR